ncbi:MAG TPA: hypothetical protein VHB79_32510 [Polyangiaceae bacterium]|nr:hypothetical protein [Polyangiaceae bacterium]
MPALRSRSACCALALCALASACGLDQRTLRPTETHTGAAGSTTDSSTGGESAQGPVEENGGAGGSAAAGVPIPSCDYSGSVSQECATLAENAGFASDVSGWELDGGVLGTWQETDAKQSKASGSIAVLNTLSGTDDGVAPGAARQCLLAKAGKAYDLASDVFIEPDQGDGEMPGAPYSGSAVLGAFFFDTADCAGSSVGFISADPVSTTDTWVHVTATGVAPPGTRAISVRLGAFKPIRQDSFQAAFDNVLVRERAP